MKVIVHKLNPTHAPRVTVFADHDQARCENWIKSCITEWNNQQQLTEQERAHLAFGGFDMGHTSGCVMLDNGTFISVTNHTMLF